MHRFLAIGLVATLALAVCGEAAAWSWPADGEVLRPFALGADAYAGGQHRGVDVAGADGSAVRAPASGVVTFAGSLPTYGRGVTILTSDGYAVTLVHLGAIGVAKGDTVSEGTAIGTMGTSGTPEQSVPSVHLGIRRASEEEGYVDPLGLLPPRATAPPPSSPAPAPSPAPVQAATPVVVAQQPPPGAAAPAPASPPAPVLAPSGPVATASPAPSVTTATADGAAATATATGPVATPLPPSATAGDGAENSSSSEADVATSGASAPGVVLTSPAVATRLASAPLAQGVAHDGVARGGVRTAASGGAVATGAVDTSARTRSAVASEAGRPAREEGLGEARVDGQAEPRLVGDARVHDPAVGPIVPAEDVAAARKAVVPAPSRPATRPSTHDVRAEGTLGASAARSERTAVGSPAVLRPGGIGLPELAAAFALAVLAAVAVGRRVARRIGIDGAVLRHNADLLRQLDAAHRARVHDRGRGRVRAPSAATRT